MTERQYECRLSDGDDRLTVVFIGDDDLLRIVGEHLREIARQYRRATDPMVIVHPGSPCDGCPG